VGSRPAGQNINLEQFGARVDGDELQAYFLNFHTGLQLSR
jgi:hypothetical protein